MTANNYIKYILLSFGFMEDQKIGWLIFYNKNSEFKTKEDALYDFTDYLIKTMFYKYEYVFEKDFLDECCKKCLEIFKNSKFCNVCGRPIPNDLYSDDHLSVFQNYILDLYNFTIDEAWSGFGNEDYFENSWTYDYLPKELFNMNKSNTVVLEEKAEKYIMEIAEKIFEERKGSCFESD